MTKRGISKMALRGATALFGGMVASLMATTPARAASDATCTINGLPVQVGGITSPIFIDSGSYAAGSLTVCQYAIANPSSLSIATDFNGQKYYHVNIPLDPYSVPADSTRYYLANTQTLVINPATQTTNTVNAYATTIEGKLLGGNLLYNQAFDQPYASAAVQAGVAAARLAITTAGGPGVVLSTPTLVAHVVNSHSTTTSAYTLNHVATADQISTTEYVGGTGTLSYISLANGFSLVPDPATNGVQTVEKGGVNSTVPVLVGQISDCTAAVSALPSSTKPVCSTSGGHSVLMSSGSVAYITSVNDTVYVDEADTVTTTTLTSETWLITGIVKPIGVIHAVAAEAAFDTSEGFWQRSLDRIGADAGRWRPWIATWGQSRGTRTQGSAVGDLRTGSGIEGGLALQLSRRLVVGAGLSAGTGHLALADGSESGRLAQVDGGIFARWGGDRGLALRLGAGLGGGHVDTIVSIPTIADNATARETVQTRWALAEASAPIAVAGGRLVFTPVAGIGYTRARLGGFAETGSIYALEGAAVTRHRLREWGGLQVAIPIVPALTMLASAEAIHYDGDIAPARAVAFAQFPATIALDVASTRMARWGGQGMIGFDARIAKALSVFASGGLMAQDSHTDQFITVGLRGHF